MERVLRIVQDHPGIVVGFIYKSEGQVSWSILASEYRLAEDYLRRINNCEREEIRKGMYVVIPRTEPHL